MLASSGLKRLIQLYHKYKEFPMIKTALGTPGLLSLFSIPGRVKMINRIQARDM